MTEVLFANRITDEVTWPCQAISRFGVLVIKRYSDLSSTADRVSPLQSASGRDMIALTEATRRKVRQLFSQEQYPVAVQLLESECGNNLPFLQHESAEGLERFQFAVLKISDGNLEKLRSAIELAKKDWRDLLVTAGFANSVDAHKSWNPR